MKRLSILSALLPALFAQGLFISHMAERSGGGDGGNKLEKELVDAADITDQKRGEDRQDFLTRLMKGIKELSDKAWDKLSDDAQGWYNANAEAQNVNKKDPDPKFKLTDIAGSEEEEKPAGRRRAAEDDEPQTASADNLKKGQRVKITNKRGKVFEGEVTDLDKDTVVVGEDEIALDRIDTIEIFHGTAGGAEEPEDPISVGKNVTLVTKRGKTVSGKIVELTDELVVLSVDGEDTEFMRDRVDSIKPAGGAAEDDGGRRRSSGDDKASDKGADKGSDKKEKEPRASNAPGVSIGQAIKDIMAKDPDIKEEDIGKRLKKDGIDYKDATLRLNFLENSKMIAALRAAKQMK